MTGARDRLPAAVLAAYALPALPLAALTLPLFIYLPAYYAETLGLGFGAVGGALLVARLWDVVTDPVVGVLSDRTRIGAARWLGGRRRPWVLAGMPLVVAASWALFRPGDGVGIGYLLGWSLVLYLGWSVMSLPYQAWGAELSRDYHERSRISGWREAGTVAGTLVAAGLPAAIGLFAHGTAAGDGQTAGMALGGLAWLVVLLLPATALLLARVVPDPPRPPGPQLGLARSARLLLDNLPFRRLIVAYLLNGLANGLPATLFLLFVGHVLAAPEAAGPLLFVYFLCGIAAVPVWLRISRAIGKHRSWSIAMVGACLAFAAVPLLGPGDVAIFALICIVSGFALGADLSLPASIQADVVDVDTAAGGGGRAGLYFALWGMATKLALALAVGLAFPLLDLAGFAADAAEPGPGLQGGRGLGTLSLLYGAAPIAFKLAAVWLMWSFPLTESTQADLRLRIERGAAAADRRCRA